MSPISATIDAAAPLAASPLTALRCAAVYPKLFVITASTPSGAASPVIASLVCLSAPVVSSTSATVPVTSFTTESGSSVNVTAPAFAACSATVSLSATSTLLSSPNCAVVAVASASSLN